MVDNEAIVNQIVRSLSFKVVTVPQNAIQVDSTSKLTPLNVKIRVRKKHGSDLRHGVLSMPKMDTRIDSRKHELPDRVRLVSSDQTIMNFNVLMEADFEKRNCKQDLNMISPGLEVNEKENVNLLENADDFNTLPVIAKRNKDIFGKCKPGGCLDPPFGEDKYTYQPTHQKNSLQAKDDTGTAKLKRSSIFKNNIFKRKRKNSQVDDELIISDTSHKKEVNSKTKLSKKWSLEVSSPYSNSIITYPHPLDSNIIYKQEEKKISREDIEQSFRKRYSSNERSKASSIEDGSYFMIPKKVKNLSNQHDLNKMQKNFTKSGENPVIKDVLRATVNPENVEYNKADQLNSQAQSFIPVPLIVPLNAPINLKSTYNETSDIDSGVESNTQPTNVTKNKINSQTELMTICSTDNLITDQKNLKLSKSETSSNEEFENKDSANTQFFLLNLEENCSKPNINDSTFNGFNLEDQTDVKSQPILAEDRERSLLDVSADPNNQVKEIYKKNPHSSDDLNYIWENKTEALKSMADVIITKTILPTDVESGQINEKFSKLEKIVEKSAGDIYDHREDDIKQKEKQLKHQIISKTDFQTRSVALSNTAVVGGEKSAQVSRNVLAENFNEHESYMQNFDKEVIQKKSLDKLNYVGTSDSIEHTIVNGTADHYDEYDETSDKIVKLEFSNDKLCSNLSFKNSSDDFHVDKIGESTKIALKDTSFTSFSEDDSVTVKGIFSLKNKSVSEQSIMGSGSLRHIPADVSSEDDKQLKINLYNNREEPITPQNIKQDTNVTSFRQTPYHSSEIERPGLTSQIENGENKFEIDQAPKINLPKVLYETFDSSQPTSILRSGFAPWKIDIALQSYIDENNEKIIKTFDSKGIPERHLNDAILVAKCYLGDELNEIKIPIDEDNNLSVKVVNINTPHRKLLEFNSNVNSTDKLFGQKKIKPGQSDKSQQKSQANVNVNSKVQIHEKKKIKINVPASDSNISEEYNAESNKYSKEIVSDDIRNALNSIYEEELVPLQGIIKGLREEIDALIAYQMKLKVQNLRPNRSKTRLAQPHKKCYCLRRM